MAKKSNNGKKSKNEKLSQLLNETRPKVYLDITDDKEESNNEHPGRATADSGSVKQPYNSVQIGDKWWTNYNGTASIESLGTRLSADALNGLTAYKTVVNGVERVVDLKNMDEAIEFVNLLLNIGEDGK